MIIRRTLTWSIEPHDFQRKNSFPSSMCVCIRVTQLREFLHHNHRRLGNGGLILYCYQLSSALTYLDSKKFVHRYYSVADTLANSHIHTGLPAQSDSEQRIDRIE